MVSRLICAISAVLALSVSLISFSASVGAKTVSLESGGTLMAGDHDEVITDRDTLDQISYQNSGDTDPTFEAYWDRGVSSVFMNHHRSGFVQMDDWDELNVEELWDSYVEGAREQSEWLGYTVHPVRWVIEPTLNREAATAYYALEVQFGDEAPVVNMVIYDFGRFGYEELTLVQASHSFPVNEASTIATDIAWSHRFGKDSRYRDFQEGDKIAAVGAAGLVAAAMGVKFGKGFLALALIFLKKFWFVLFLIPAALWRFVRPKA